MTEPKRKFSSIPGQQYYDEVTIRTIPRFKTSSASGNEWRIKAEAIFRRKGVVLGTMTGSDAPSLAEQIRSGNIHWNTRAFDPHVFDSFCAQDGCSEPGINTHRVLQTYCNSCAHPERDMSPILGDTVLVRSFCARHSDRGDASYNDRNENYELIEGPGTVTTVSSDVSPSEAIMVRVAGNPALGIS